MNIEKEWENLLLLGKQGERSEETLRIMRNIFYLGIMVYHHNITLACDDSPEALRKLINDVNNQIHCELTRESVRIQH